MRFLPIPRDPDDFQQPLSPDEIVAACARAFPAMPPVSAHELSGGEFNSIYRVHLAGQRAPVILRAAPASDRDLPWHDRDLLRREHTLAPYFAPIAPLLPRTLMSDFTHEVMDRDYIFQTRMPGRQWFRVARRLSAETTATLLRQMAAIAQSIHAVRGIAFGDPWPGRVYPTWSATVLDWLERSLRDAERAGIETDALRQTLTLAQAGAAALDAVREPRLLHGDLWTFNILISGGEGDPRICAIFDYDRGGWGDPLIEWTFHLLPHRASLEEQAIFWEAYGRPPEDDAARFRIALYEVYHMGNVLTDLRLRHMDAQLPKVHALYADGLAALRAVQM